MSSVSADAPHRLKHAGGCVPADVDGESVIVCVTYPGIGASALTLDTPYEYWFAKFLLVNTCKASLE